jgi:hypothetical protein
MIGRGENDWIKMGQTRITICFHEACLVESIPGSLPSALCLTPALEPTPYTLRSCLAPVLARGSGPALD